MRRASETRLSAQHTSTQSPFYVHMLELHLFFLKGNDKVLRLSSYAPYKFGGLEMRVYESMVKVFLFRRRMG